MCTECTRVDAAGVDAETQTVDPEARQTLRILAIGSITQYGDTPLFRMLCEVFDKDTASACLSPQIVEEEETSAPISLDPWIRAPGFLTDSTSEDTSASASGTESSFGPTATTVSTSDSESHFHVHHNDLFAPDDR